MEKTKLNTGKIIVVLMIIAIIVHLLVPPYQRVYEPQFQAATAEEVPE